MPTYYYEDFAGGALPPEWSATFNPAYNNIDVTDDDVPEGFTHALRLSQHTPQPDPFDLDIPTAEAALNVTTPVPWHFEFWAKLDNPNPFVGASPVGVSELNVPNGGTSATGFNFYPPVDGGAIATPEGWNKYSTEVPFFPLIDGFPPFGPLVPSIFDFVVRDGAPTTTEHWNGPMGFWITGIRFYSLATALRLYPRDDARGFAGVRRMYPSSSSARTVGGIP